MKRKKDNLGKEAMGMAKGLIGFGVVGGVGSSVVTGMGGSAASVSKLTSYSPLIANVSGAGMAYKGLKRFKGKY